MAEKPISSLEEPTFLQQTTDRETILDTFLADLTTPSDEYPGEPISQPAWGAVYTTGAHLAVKTPAQQSFFRHAGEPDYNIFQLPIVDLLTTLARYELVVKTAGYDVVDQKGLLYDAFDHGLNEAVIPPAATETAFITATNTGEEIRVCYVTADGDSSNEPSLEDSTVTMHDADALPALLLDATSLYPFDSPVIPDGLSRKLRD